MEMTGKKLRYVLEVIIDVDLDDLYEGAGLLEEVMSQACEHGECRIIRVYTIDEAIDQ